MGQVTHIKTVHEYLLKPLALFEGVDLFIYFPTRITGLQWDEDPRKFQHFVGDVEACKLYANHPIFHPSTGNKVFCQTAYETDRRDYFVRQYLLWKNTYRGYGGSEAYLTQLYDHYEGNLDCKEYSVLTDVKHIYKVRLRPDTMMWGPIPDPNTFPFNKPSVMSSSRCSKKIFMPENSVFGYGVQDSFNFGEAVDMDDLLDRYMDHSIKPSIVGPNQQWSSEYYVATLISTQYGVRLMGNERFLMSLARVRNNQKPLSYDFEENKTSQWSLINIRRKYLRRVLVMV
jgi:hypothetical protein